MAGGSFVVAGILAWTAFAFGAIYPTTASASAIACVGLTLLYRPGILGRGPTPELDRRLLVLMAAAALQLMPLPRMLLGWISPAADSVSQSFRLVDTGGPLPLSIDLRKSAAAVLMYGTVIALFFTCRQIYSTGGVRTIARLLALIGFALAGLAIAQDATARGLMYWTWRPIDEGPPPFGPFVNRNHFGTWAVLAVPLCIGYLAAHAVAHHGPGPHATWRLKLLAALDGRVGMLLGASTLLILAIVVSLSRSSMIGLVAAFAAGAVLVRLRAADALGRSARPAVLLGAAVVLAAIAMLARVDPSRVTERFSATSSAAVDRLTIWGDTLGVIRDFWLTGTGVGTYQTSMAVYQRSSPGVIFNQAHNHYLQVISEGGLLVAVPALLALVAFVRAASRSLSSDRSRIFWLRAGAASGLCGVAVQSLFETGLTTPANAALAAVLAAIVIHAPGRSRSR